MKKVAFVLSFLFIGTALADSTPTSVGYVDNAIGALQNKISAVDTNTVLTHTNTAGEIGQKSIYDATGNYVEQQNALVTAEVANAEHTTENCLIYTVHNQSPNRILPTGYTPLEYVSTGDTVSLNNPYINSGVNLANGIKLELDIKFNSTEKQHNGTYANGTRLDIAIGTTNTGTQVFRMNYGDINSTSIAADTARHTFIIDTHNLYWAIDNHRENYTTNVAVNNSLIYIGGREDSGGNFLYTHTAEKIYSAKIYMNDLIIRNLIPARRDSDGELGMYDLVSRTFFTNAGTGEFIAGPELNVYLPSGN